ncbi:alpha/beta hydrolase [Novosphingobium sp.]|uniref:alpha/beta hydrolase n=1 Tax=Novosphingobium sp. TaxID=1874826 RepID=UPI00263285A3|nr:alpha/beta hydrolase [Novosphingobium sp.]
MDVPVNRRQVLLGSGALLMPAPALASRAALEIPAGGGPLPPEWTAAEAIPLWPDAPPGAPAKPPVRSTTLDPAFITGVVRPELRVFRPAQSNGRALLVIPGGAYTFISIRNEGTDVARVMTAHGYTVFVLVYRLPAEGWANRADVPLQDAQRAMRVIRAGAAGFGIDPATVAVLGFSAGGHLAASLITAAADQVYAPRDRADALDARPHSAGLIYPVIAATPPHTHPLSAQNLLGPAPTPELVTRRSPALHVNAMTPPTFLVHSFDDEAVPYQNTMLFLDALREARRPAELHLFEEGGHGFGIGPANAPAGYWPTLFAAFLDRHAPRVAAA